MNKQTILSCFRQRFETLTDNQKKIAKYLFDHYETAAFMSAGTLARAVGVSEATVIRFCGAVGFKGYGDMMKRIRDGIQLSHSPAARISKSLEIMHNQKHLFKQIIQNDVDHLVEFAKTIDFQRMNCAVEEICRAKRIFLTGLGSSSLLISFLHMQLRRMGFDVICTSTAGIFDYEKMLLLRKGDLMLLCTFPRYAKNTLHAAIFAKKQGVKVVAITDSDFSPVSANSDIILRAKVDNITFFHSWVVGMELCNLLLMSVLEHQGEKAYEKVKQSNKSIEYFYDNCDMD